MTAHLLNMKLQLDQLSKFLLGIFFPAERTEEDNPILSWLHFTRKQ